MAATIQISRMKDTGSFVAALRVRVRVCEGVGEGEGVRVWVRVCFTRLSQASYDDRFERGLIRSSSGKFGIQYIFVRTFT